MDRLNIFSKGPKAFRGGGGSCAYNVRCTMNQRANNYSFLPLIIKKYFYLEIKRNIKDVKIADGF